MDRTVLSLIGINVLLTSLAQIVLKSGMSSQPVTQSLAHGVKVSSALVVFANPHVIIGLIMYFGSALIWLVVLSRVEVSLAYPFVGLGFIVTMVLGGVVHGDALSASRVVGTLLVALGVVMLARS